MFIIIILLMYSFNYGTIKTRITHIYSFHKILVKTSIQRFFISKACWNIRIFIKMQMKTLDHKSETKQTIIQLRKPFLHRKLTVPPIKTSNRPKSSPHWWIPKQLKIHLKLLCPVQVLGGTGVTSRVGLRELEAVSTKIQLKTEEAGPATFPH